MSLKNNLDIAERAVWYTQGKITIGASNRREAFFSFGASTLCVVAMRGVNVSTPAVGEVPGWIAELASKAEATGCGNCGEQAAIAFLYLYTGFKAKPIDYMARTNADHAFVVIGRKNDSNLLDVTTWGNDATICDPWDGTFYSALKASENMCAGKVFAPDSICRIE